MFELGKTFKVSWTNIKPLNLHVVGSLTVGERTGNIIFEWIDWEWGAKQGAQTLQN